MIDLASRYFGSLPPREDLGETKKTSNLPVFPFGKKLTIQVPTQIFKNLLIMAYPTEDTWNIERTRCFSLLAEIFSDRLRQQVRENMGAAYSPFAFNRSFRAYSGYGLFQVMVYAEPEKIDAIISEIRGIAEKLASDGIEIDELERVRTPAVNRIQDMVRRNEYWLNSVLSDSRRYPQQIDWSRSSVQTYVSVRPEDLNQLARTYLNARKAAVFIAGPERFFELTRQRHRPGVEKQESGRQARRAAMRQAQHIQAYVSIGEPCNAESAASGAVFQHPARAGLNREIPRLFFIFS